MTVDLLYETTRESDGVDKICFLWSEVCGLVEGDQGRTTILFKTGAAYSVKQPYAELWKLWRCFITESFRDS